MTFERAVPKHSEQPALVAVSQPIGALAAHPGGCGGKLKLIEATNPKWRYLAEDFGFEPLA